MKGRMNGMESNGMFFLDVQITHEGKTFTTSVYRKPIFSGVVHILTAFYHLPISLVLFTHSLINAS